MNKEVFQSFTEFYPFYIKEHQNRISRTLHVVGTGLVLLNLVGLLWISAPAWYFISLPLTGYGFAWVGHFFFEKNRPATFQYPLWSLRGDFTLFFEICTGARKINSEHDPENLHTQSE